MESVPSVNALTARWARNIKEDGTSTVLSGLGIWPLLAFLATGAEGRARQALEEALGTPAEQAAGQARELLATLRGLPGIDAALGLWTRDDLQLDPGWLAGLAADSHGLLSGDGAADSAMLDAWADRSTGGLIKRMPVPPARDLRLLLASALTVRTRWRYRFQESWVRPAAGPWAGAGRKALRLTVQANEWPDALSLAETPIGPVTELRVLGTDGIDVHLFLGPEDTGPGEVLAAGIDILAGLHRRIPVAALAEGEPGPGLCIEQEMAPRPEDQLSVTTVPFTLGVEHDLLALAPLFGLGAGSFSRISPGEPLIVSSARQAAVATFGATGFEAGVISAIGMGRGARGHLANHRIRHTRAVFDRPFAYLAVHRPSGLALVGGWHAAP